MDLAIRNATIIDGSGTPRFRGDVGIRDGRICAIGTVAGQARQEIDAAGAVVAPGFIDVHTHYDAQAFWDPMLSPSVYHGVTTVLGGNCGFSIAPLSGKAADADYLLRMLSRVEGMPLESLRTAVPADWTAFGEFLDKLEGKLAINACFMVGHSALRRTVMGDRAVGHEASEEEIAAMCALLHRSLEEGGMGFSTTVSITHSDLEGQPVPSRWASRAELLALARVVRDFPGTLLEVLPGVGEFGENEYSLMTDMSVAAQRPVNWNMLSPVSYNPGMTTNQLAASDHARERGGMVLALVTPVPPKMRLNFISGFVMDALPGWGEVVTLPLEQRKAALRDPAVRARLLESAASPEAGPIGMLFQMWDNFLLDETFLDKNKAWQGKLLSEYAQSVGKAPFDALVDLALEEDLRTSFSPPVFGGDDESFRMRAEAWVDERCVVGASDAGAHLDMIDTFAFSTQLLGGGVRKRGLIGLEQAVHQLTARPASLFGFSDRGRLEVGTIADLVIFDPETVDCGPVYTRNDLPGGHDRLYADAIGVDTVIVGGVPVVRGGEATGELGGRILRSGRDTETVKVPAAA